MFCPSCGNEVIDAAKFCNKCGTKIEAPGAGEQGVAVPVQAQPPVPQYQQGYAGSAAPAYIPSVAGQLDITDCVRQGWNMVMSDLGIFIAAIVITFAINIVVGMIPIAGGFAAIFLYPLNAGIMIMAFKKMGGGKPEVGDVFAGFRRYGDLLLVQLIVGIFAGLATLLLIIPGIFLGVCYMMAKPLVIDRGMGFWDAMSLSMQEVRKQWWTLFGLGVVIVLVNIAGMLALGVGLFISVPVSICALAVAYSKMFGLEGKLP